MEESQDIRWVQRSDSFRKACKRVLDITESDQSPSDLSELEQEGLIQRFEVTTSHTYNEGEAIEIVQKIYDEYSALLKQLNTRLAHENLNLNNGTLF